MTASSSLLGMSTEDSTIMPSLRPQWPRAIPFRAPRTTDMDSFQQCRGRVPAVAISPLIPRNLIDHRLYDHASIPATLQALFGLNAMTQRDARANNLTPLL